MLRTINGSRHQSPPQLPRRRPGAKWYPENWGDDNKNAMETDKDTEKDGQADEVEGGHGRDAGR